MKRLVSFIVLFVVIPIHAGPESLYAAIENDRGHEIDDFLAKGGDPDMLVDWAYEAPEARSRPMPLLEVALHLARDRIAVKLLQAGADPTAIEHGIGRPFVALAAGQGMLQTAMHLIRADPDVLVRGAPGSSLLAELAVYGTAESVAAALTIARQHELDLSGQLDVALFDAGVNAKEDVFGLLLTAGADPRTDGALHLAAFHMSGDMVRRLLAGGADPQFRMNMHERPLDLAIARLNVEGPTDDAVDVFRALVRASAEPCARLPDAEAFREIPSVLEKTLRRIDSSCEWSRVLWSG